MCATQPSVQGRSFWGPSKKSWPCGAGFSSPNGSYVEPDELYGMVSDWKRRIIENCLYGVDINPEAVEICRLRLWLSMVLDMVEPPDPGSDWALPNLDFQIVAGDSLVDRITGVTLVKGSWPTRKVVTTRRWAFRDRTRYGWSPDIRSPPDGSSSERTGTLATAA